MKLDPTRFMISLFVVGLAVPARAEPACDTPAHEKAQAEGSKISAETCDPDKAEYYSSNEEEWRPGWIARAGKVDAEVRRYTALHAKWSGCHPRLGFEFSDYYLEQCKQVRDAYRTGHAKAVDELLETLKKETDGDNDLHRQEGFARYRPEAARLLDVGNKMKPYKVKELEAVIAEADRLTAARDKADLAAVAKTSCPAGKKLSGEKFKVVNDEFSRDSAIKRIIRQVGAPGRLREGVISRESIPVIVCSRFREKDGEFCNAVRASVYRDKPPGGEWTSWMLAVGGGYGVNCKSLK